MQNIFSNFQKVNWKKFQAKTVEEFLDLIFPRICYGCKKEGTYICKDCETFLSENSLICPMCGNPSFTGKSCKSCKGRYGLDGLVAGWDYEGIIKKAVLDIKADYHDVTEKIMERFFLLMASQEERFGDFLQFLLQKEVKVTYVPANKRKNQKNFMLRGDKDNVRHSQTLAEKVVELSGKDKNSLVDLLVKVKPTEKQAKLAKKERMSNVKGVFDIKHDPPEKMVLVDDVFTTGATMRECCRTLKKEGAKEVWGLVLVRSV